jgi:sterol desaturase/sphingolipid hydroxylase (fatty acid hydroxylase superfamily)
MTEDSLNHWISRAAVLGFALGIVLLLAEGWWSRTPLRLAPGRRWLVNLLVYLATLAVTSVLPPLSLLAVSLVAQGREWGLFHAADVPLVLAIPLSVLAVDLVEYFFHRLEHRQRWLWQVHRLHHSDPDVDVTTGLRFHPVEVLLRAALKGLVAGALGMPPVAAAGYIMVATLVAILSHANVVVPDRFERALQWLVITPGMHRTHHSIDPEDASSNFSVCIAGWDRLFGTFRKAPNLGHRDAIFGVESRTDAAATSIVQALLDPFRPEQSRALSSSPRSVGKSDKLQRAAAENSLDGDSTD